MAAEKVADISSAAVQKATGKSWAEWIAILDAIGGKRMTHQEIVTVLRDQHGVGPWWQQMLTVGYEQAVGKRVKHQRPDGFSINRSRTIAASATSAFVAWKDKRQRSRWLTDADLTIRKATPHKSMRITWDDGETHLDVHFYPKGPANARSPSNTPGSRPRTRRRR